MVERGFAPAMAASAMPMTSVSPTAASGRPTRRRPEGAAMGSSRTLEPLTRHP